MYNSQASLTLRRVQTNRSLRSALEVARPTDNSPVAVMRRSSKSAQRSHGECPAPFRAFVVQTDGGDVTVGGAEPHKYKYSRMLFLHGSQLLPSAKVRFDPIRCPTHALFVLLAHVPVHWPARVHSLSALAPAADQRTSRTPAHSTRGDGTRSQTHRAQLVESFSRICWLSVEVAESKRMISLTIHARMRTCAGR